MNGTLIHIKQGTKYPTFCGAADLRLAWVTEHDADQMDGIYKGRNGRNLRTLPPIKGEIRVKKIRDCIWCEACWESPRRALKLLKNSDL